MSDNRPLHRSRRYLTPFSEAIRLFSFSYLLFLLRLMLNTFPHGIRGTWHVNRLHGRSPLEDIH